MDSTPSRMRTGATYPNHKYLALLLQDTLLFLGRKVTDHGAERHPDRIFLLHKCTQLRRARCVCVLAVFQDCSFQYRCRGCRPFNLSPRPNPSVRCSIFVYTTTWTTGPGLYRQTGPFPDHLVFPFQLFLSFLLSHSFAALQRSAADHCPYLVSTAIYSLYFRPNHDS